MNIQTKHILAVLYVEACLSLRDITWTTICENNNTSIKECILWRYQGPLEDNNSDMAYVDAATNVLNGCISAAPIKIARLQCKAILHDIIQTAKLIDIIDEKNVYKIENILLHSETPADDLKRYMFIDSVFENTDLESMSSNTNSVEDKCMDDIQKEP